MATLEQRAANISSQTVHELATAGKDVLDFVGNLIPRDENGHIKVTPAEVGAFGLAALGAILYTERQYRLEHPELQNASIPEVLSDMRQHPQEVLAAARDGLPAPLQKGADAVGHLFDDITRRTPAQMPQTQEMSLPALAPALPNVSSLPDQPTQILPAQAIPPIHVPSSPEGPPFHPPSEPISTPSSDVEKPTTPLPRIDEEAQRQAGAVADDELRLPRPTGPIYRGHGPDVGYPPRAQLLPQVMPSNPRNEVPQQAMQGMQGGVASATMERETTKRPSTPQLERRQAVPSLSQAPTPVRAKTRQPKRTKRHWYTPITELNASLTKRQMKFRSRLGNLNRSTYEPYGRFGSRNRNKNPR